MYNRSKGMALRSIALVLALLMAAMAVSACSSQAPATSSAPVGTSESAAPSGDEAPFEIEILTRFHTPESPTAENLAVAEIERIANVKLNITWIPQTAYDDKINVTIASGDYPQVMLITGNAKPMAVEVEAVRAGMFWKVGDYLQDYDNLKSLNASAIENASIDGELWGMYRTRPLARTGFFYRTDWMEKFNLEAPKSPEHLKEILRKFVNEDPDGNGVNDTAGMAQEDLLDSAIAAVAPYFGLPHKWFIENDTLRPIQYDERYFEIVKWFKECYDEGLMNRDFPTVNSAQRDELMTGRYGFAFTSIDKGDKAVVALQQINPNADFTVGLTFSEAPEQYIWGRAGWDGKYYISTQKVKEEADVRRIMEYFNAMHSPEISNLIAYGFEGTHYDKVDDKTIRISEEQKTKFLQEIEVMEQLGFRYTVNNYSVADMPSYQAQYTEIFKTKDALTRGDPTAAFNSETYNEKGKDLETFLNDTNTKFITGAIDEAGWRSAIEQWGKTGFDNIVKEYQEVYDATK